MLAMMDDFKRLRVSEEILERPGLRVGPDDPPSFLGQVVSAAAKVGVGRFLLVNPVSVLGSEVEGAPGSFTVDTGTTVPVYLIGPSTPSKGEYMICRFVEHRWVADRPAPTSTAPIGIGIPGCLCQGTPASLSLTISYGPGEDARTYANAYQSCTLGYFTSPPGYMPESAFTGAGYYSTTSWVDDYGFTDYFRLNCYSVQYALGFGQNNLGIWQAPGRIYTWTLGGSPAVNSCSPFLLAVGHPQAGVAFNGKIVVSG